MENSYSFVKIILFNLVFFTYLFSMEGDGAGLWYGQNSRKEFQVFDQLPKELKITIISFLSQGDINVALDNIRNALLVNKEWEQLINSEQGTQAIIAELLNNGQVKRLFNQINQEITRFKFLGGPLTDNQKKVILLSLLATRQAKIVLATHYKKDLESLEDHFWSQIIQMLGKIKTKEITTLHAQTLIVIVIDTLKQFKAIKGPDWHTKLRPPLPFFLKRYLFDVYPDYDEYWIQEFPELVHLFAQKTPLA